MTADLVLNATVLSLSVLSNGDQVHIVVAGAIPLNRATRPHVGIQVEHPGYTTQQHHHRVCVLGGTPPESKVEGDGAFANLSLKRTWKE